MREYASHARKQCGDDGGHGGWKRDLTNRCQQLSSFELRWQRGLTLLVLPLELLDEVVDQAVIEVLTSKVSITSGGLDFEDTLPSGLEGCISSSSSEIEDKDFAFIKGLLIETVGDSSSSGLVDGAEDIKARDSTSVLSGLTIRH